jgi:hypothetical protein
MRVFGLAQLVMVRGLATSLFDHRSEPAAADCLAQTELLAAIMCSRGDLTIGRHCVIAANSVVTGSIPDYSVAFGLPAW